MVEINKTITLKLIFLISIIALSSAFFIEYVLGHQPCNLCILERIPYLLALIIIVLNYKFINLEKYFILSLILIFLAATFLSLYHLGIEQGFIEESLVCDLKNGSNLLSKEDILKQLQEKNVSCKDVTFKILGLSLTSFNIIISTKTMYHGTTGTWLHLPASHRFDLKARAAVKLGIRTTYVLYFILRFCFRISHGVSTTDNLLLFSV